MTLRIFAVSAVLLAAAAIPARAQQARINGFVTDRSDGQALELVNVVAEDDGGELRGTVTSRDGLYQITRLDPGRYTLRASFIGYETYTDTLDLAPGEIRTLNIRLAEQAAGLGEVQVEAERTSGAARVTAGQQTVRPAEVELVPAPDVSGDLAAYLTTLPGVVSTGDQGGQLFIRGGEPTQNLILLDGIPIYQPFHLIGFYSVFPSDLLSKADVYAGGYGAKFGERISSVIDVWTREGDKRRFGGAVSVSPFIGTALLEGPLVPGRVSFLASVRRSTLEQGAERVIGRDLPFDFGDAFAKVHAALGSRARLSAVGISTFDRGVLHEEGPDDDGPGDEGRGFPAEEVRWRNQAAGLRYLGLPRLLPISVDLRASYSRLESELGPAGAPTRSSSVDNLQLALDASFLGDRVDVDAGWSLNLVSTSSNLGGVFQNVELSKTAVNHVAGYVEPEFSFGDLRVRAGLRMQFYALRIDPYLEPRLRLVWARGAHQVSAAAGVYHQETVGLVDQRDAASVFTAWTHISSSSRRGENVLKERLPRAEHAILGYRVTPSAWLEVSVEGFYRRLDNLFVPEWSSYPRLTTRLQPAEGRSLGFDARAEVRRGPFYAAVTYGLSSTRYEAKQASLRFWYGDASLAYRPPHDRRHQINALANVQLHGFDLSVRWEFGSGLPFSRPRGFDGFVVVDDVEIGPTTPWSRRVIYERPYNAELPTYHRLDVSLERTFTAGRAAVTVAASVINAYDRRNIFFVDVFTLRRQDQLPLVPSLGLKVAYD